MLFALGTGKGKPQETDGPAVAEGLGGCNIQGVEDSKTKIDITKEDAGDPAISVHVDDNDGCSHRAVCYRKVVLAAQIWPLHP